MTNTHQTTEEEAKKSKPKVSEEERKRRSERAKALHKKGVFGGKQRGGGRPRNKRASEHVAEEAAKSADEIVKAIKSALKSDSATTRLKAAIAWLEIENKETERKDKREQKQFENATQAELVSYIVERIRELESSGRLPKEFDFEGDAREVEPRGIERVSRAT